MPSSGLCGHVVQGKPINFPNAPILLASKLISLNFHPHNPHFFNFQRNTALYFPQCFQR